MQAALGLRSSLGVSAHRIGCPSAVLRLSRPPGYGYVNSGPSRVKLQAAAELRAQTAPIPRPGVQAWQVVVATTATALLLLNIHRSTFTTLLPFVSEHHALTMTQVGWVQSAMLMGYLVGQLPAGWAADTFGGERILLAGLLLWSLALASTAFASDLPLLLASRACMGLFSACMMPCVSSMASAWVPQQVKAATIASVYMFFNLGGVLGLVGIPGLVTQVGWQQAFLMAGGGGVLWALIGWTTLPDRPASHTGHRHTSSSTQHKQTTNVQAGTQATAAVLPSTNTSHTSTYPRDSQTQEDVSTHSTKPIATAVATAAATSVAAPETAIIISSSSQVSSAQHSGSDGVGHQAAQGGGQPEVVQAQAGGKTGGVQATQVLALCWAHAVIGWGFFIFQSWMPLYLKSLGTGSLSTTGLLSSLPWLAAGLLGTVTGSTADRWIQSGWPRLTVRRLMHGVSTLGCAACVLPLYCMSSVDPLVATAWLTAFNCCYAASFGGFHAYIQDVAGKHAGKLTGLTNSCGIVLGIVGNLATGWLLEISGSYGSVFMATAILYVTSFLGFFHLNGKALQPA